MDPRLAMNRPNWNERAPVHAASDFYGVQRFKAGAISLNEREEVGPVAGQSLLHLQCHFGMETMSWSRLGARATGVDCSDAAIDLARELSAELDLDTRFICSNVYDLPEALDEQFDVVYGDRRGPCAAAPETVSLEPACAATPTASRTRR